MTEGKVIINRRNWETYDLSEDAKLDRFALELEAEQQSQKMDKWLNLLEQAQQIATDAKRHLQYVESKLFLQAKQGGMSGIVKEKGGATDAAAKAWVNTQQEYRAALQSKDSADIDLMKLQHAKTVMLGRKESIKILSELWICGYFSKPYISSKVNSQVQDDMRQVSKEKLTESMSKRIRREAEEHLNGQFTESNEDGVNTED